MPDEPLIFVEVALVDAMAGNVQTLLDESQPPMNPERADTAVFYSISNAQAGLSGISFGNFLIKRVVEKLSKELPRIKHFSTLSPIPGFRKWLDPKLAAEDESILAPDEAKRLKVLDGEKHAGRKLLQILEQGNWHMDAKRAEVIRPVLMRLCAHYLVNEKRGRLTTLDSVAHFHLTNGARMERLNWLADTSPKGFRQSAGMMVNYYYAPEDIDENHGLYTRGKSFAAARAIRQMAEV